MSTYNIDYTDPLKSGFTIQPGGFDGPGGSQSNSSLRLYGRGALEWGEAVDEDLLRLAETFAGSTPPIKPIAGQLWFQTKLYWLDTSTVPGQWHVYNPNTKTWGYLFNSSDTSKLIQKANPAAAPVSATTIGNYFYSDGSDSAYPTGLYRYDKAYKQAAEAWLRREFSSSNLGLNTHPTLPPEQTLKVFDAYASSTGTWVAPTNIAVSPSGSPPANPQVGSLWYNTTTGQLNVYNGTQWTPILVTNPSNVLTPSGNIDMTNTYKVINLPTPTASTDATNKAYVDAAVAGAGTNYLPLTGGTLTGPGNLVVLGTLRIGNNSAPAAQVQIDHGINHVRMYNGTTGIGALQLGNSATGSLNTHIVSDGSGNLFINGGNVGSGTTRIHVGSTGNVGIGGVASVALQVNSTDAVKIPAGTTAQRPSGSNGMIRYNNDTNNLEAYVNGAWTAISLGGGSASPGDLKMHYGTTAPVGHIIPDGTLLSRTTYAALWAHAQASGLVVSEATWSSSMSNKAKFSDGDGSTTFRSPDLRGLFPRAAPLGRSTGEGDESSGAPVGTVRFDQNKSHAHSSSGGATFTFGGATNDTGNGRSVGPYVVTSTGGNEGVIPNYSVGGNISTTTNSDGGVQAYPRHVLVLLVMKT